LNVEAQTKVPADKGVTIDDVVDALVLYSARKHVFLYAGACAHIPLVRTRFHEIRLDVSTQRGEGGVGGVFKQEYGRLAVGGECARHLSVL
jgi:hypothetical protein